MEICNGSSLRATLGLPGTIPVGFPEAAYLRVLRDVGSGYKYLHDNNIVHRDIKPENVMRCDMKDSRGCTVPVYKLIDFGVAKELMPGAQLTTLCGTLAYMAPEIRVAVELGHPFSQLYSATVDLWSLGVMFYEVATGQLPPMYNVHYTYDNMLQKNVVTFLGKQLDALPDSCQLSVGLKSKLVPLLAGLLQCHPNYRSTSDLFFGAVNDILSSTCIPSGASNSIGGAFS